MSSVKVAVRVRPFNAREKGRKAVSIIAMEGKATCKSSRSHKATHTLYLPSAVFRPSISA